MTRVEFFYTPGCGKCAAAVTDLKALATRSVPDLDWRDIDVQQALDYAVELGVLSLPALAINGKLVFSSMPTAAQLTQALAQAAPGLDDGH